MPYNNSSCNNSYSQPSYPSYSHPYVHHQNPHQYNGSYGQSYAPPSYGYPALSYPGYSQSYSAPRYASPSYGTPNVFSIIKTSPNDTDDNVCALNSYDTLCLETGSPDHLTITGDKANKKITFALKNVVTSVAGNETPSTGHVLAPLAKRTSGCLRPGGGTFDVRGHNRRHFGTLRNRRSYDRSTCYSCFVFSNRGGYGRRQVQHLPWSSSMLHSQSHQSDRRRHPANLLIFW